MLTNTLHHIKQATELLKSVAERLVTNVAKKAYSPTLGKNCLLSSFPEISVIWLY